MRIVILGDFHLDAKTFSLTTDAMEDIRAAKPDLVVALGDFGEGRIIGTPAGILQAHDFLKKTGAPIRPILGNHDLQCESAGKAPSGEIETTLRKTFGIENSGGFMEFDTYRLLFITSEPQDPKTCLQVQECVVGDEQFAAIQEGLARRPGVPVVAFSHAPPLGSGLRTVHNTHLRATNAWLDHNHNPSRWKTFRDTHREITLWFSAHYHLGHDYPDSQSERDGVHFFNTQVHGICTRDGLRQSRVLDIAADGRASVSTLDHNTRQIVKPPHWSGPLRVRPTPQPNEHSAQEISIGGGLCHILEVDATRVLAAMDDGFLWELDFDQGSAMGTLHMGCPLNAVALSGNHVWRAWENCLGISALDHPTRFVRAPNTTLEDQIHIRLPDKITALHPSGDGCVVAVTTSGAWRCAPDSTEPVPSEPPHTIKNTGKIPPLALLPANGDSSKPVGQWILPGNKALLAWRTDESPARTRFQVQHQHHSFCH